MLDDRTSNKIKFQGSRENACGYGGLMSMIFSQVILLLEEKLVKIQKNPNHFHNANRSQSPNANFETH